MLVVVSHDAGGAELLSSYIRQRAIPCLCVIDGPAVKVFERKLGPVDRVSLSDGLGQASKVLCGTSWESRLEFDALAMARTAGIPSVAILDHWVNYRERFTRGNEVHLPDEIWVGDALALARVAEIWPGIPAHLVDNPYLVDVAQELASLRPSRPKQAHQLSVLYVCEPVSVHSALQTGDARNLGYDEYETLRFFLERIGTLGKPVERVVVRPHPSEPADKYDWAQAGFDVPVMRGGGQTLLQEIVDSDVVVGCESMAMVIGLVAGKRVISSIPPWGRPCVLPFPEIERFATEPG